MQWKPLHMSMISNQSTMFYHTYQCGSHQCCPIFSFWPILIYILFVGRLSIPRYQLYFEKKIKFKNQPLAIIGPKPFYIGFGFSFLLKKFVYFFFQLALDTMLIWKIKTKYPFFNNKLGGGMWGRGGGVGCIKNVIVIFGTCFKYNHFLLVVQY
jgi:hypothetical protein